MLFRLAEILDIAKIGGQKNNVVLHYIPELDKPEYVELILIHVHSFISPSRP